MEENKEEDSGNFVHASDRHIVSICDYHVAKSHAEKLR